MKNILFISLLIVVGNITAACNGDGIEYGGRFNESLRAFGEFKESSDNSYIYTTSGDSWIGVSWETEITVDKGEVVRRSFRYTSIGGGIEIPEQEREWTEEGTQVGQRKLSTGEAITLDEVYEKAKNDWLRKRKNALVFFETENDGMISICGYRDKDCADDCFRGIKIIKIEALN